MISSKVVIIVFYSGKIKLRGPKFGKPFKLGSNHSFFVGYELRGPKFGRYFQLDGNHSFFLSDKSLGVRNSEDHSM